MDQKHKLAKNYAMARGNLLLMIVLTVVSIIMFLSGSSTSFPFSAYFPQSVIWSGSYVADETGSDLALTIGFVIAAVCLILYLVCYLLSKKKTGWLIVSLVLFSLDTLSMLFDYLSFSFDGSMILDIIFHAWVIYYLIIGVRCSIQLKKLATEEELMMSMGDQTVSYMAPAPQTASAQKYGQTEEQNVRQNAAVQAEPQPTSTVADDQTTSV